MAGFRNAPEITEFKRAMRVRTPELADAPWQTVLQVTHHNIAHLDSRTLTTNCGAWDLDREGVWEGQVRMSKNETLRTHILSVSNDGDVCFGNPNMRPVNFESIDYVLERYPTVVWPAPEPPVKVGDIVQVGEHMKSRAAYIGRVEWIGIDSMHIHNGKCLVGVAYTPDTVTKLVPERED